MRSFVDIVTGAVSILSPRDSSALYKEVQVTEEKETFTVTDGERTYELTLDEVWSFLKSRMHPWVKKKFEMLGPLQPDDDEDDMVIKPGAHESVLIEPNGEVYFGWLDFSD